MATPNFYLLSRPYPIPQGLQQILMASFSFGAKEHWRDFGLDPGNLNRQGISLNLQQISHDLILFGF